MVELNDDEIRAWGGFLRTHARIVRELDQELRDSHGMPLGTFDVLINLALAPEEMLRMRDLADAIVLTPAGKRALAKAAPTHFDGVRRRFLSALDTQEQERLGDVWDKIKAQDLTASH